MAIVVLVTPHVPPPYRVYIIIQFQEAACYRLRKRWGGGSRRQAEEIVGAGGDMMRK